MEANKKKVARRAMHILDIARAMAEKQDKENGSYKISNHIDSFQWHSDYANGRDSKYGIIVGNWNDITTWNNETKTWEPVSNLASRLCKLFEKIGLDIEWS